MKNLLEFCRNSIAITNLISSRSLSRVFDSERSILIVENVQIDLLSVIIGQSDFDGSRSGLSRVDGESRRLFRVDWSIDSGSVDTKLRRVNWFLDFNLENKKICFS